MTQATHSPARRARWGAGALERPFAWAATACGLGLVVLTPWSGWAVPLWFGPGLYLGPYLAALGAVLAWPARTPREQAMCSAALATLLLAAVGGGLVSAGQPLGAPQLPAALLPWPAGAIGALSGAALLARCLPLPAMRWAQLAVALLLVLPLLLAFSYVVVVNGYASRSLSLGLRLSVAACVGAAGLAFAAASILVALWRRHTAQPGRDPRDDGTALGLTLAVSLGIPLAMACGSVLGGIAAARHAMDAEKHRQQAHIEAHGRSLQAELARAGVQKVLLAAPDGASARADAAAAGHLFWQAGQWWIARVGSAPVRSEAAGALFDVAHRGDTSLWLCQRDGPDQRCWIQAGGEPQNLTLPHATPQAAGASPSTVVELPQAGLTASKLRDVQPVLEGVLGAMRALVGPALAFAALGVLLTLGVVVPLVRRLDRLRHQLAVLLEHVPAAVLTVDAQGRVAAANAAAQAWFGPGTAAPTDADGPLGRVMAATSRAAEAGHATPVEVGWSDARGQLLAVEVSAHDLPGDAEGTRVLLVHDVTRRNQAEARLQRAVRWSDAVLRAAGEGICVVTRSGELMLANPAARELLGLGDAPGPTVAAPRAVPAAVAAAWQDMVGRAVHEATMVRGEMRLADALGGERSVAYVATPFDEVLDGLVIVLRDVTAQQRTNEALDFANGLLRSTEEIGRIGSWHLDLRTGRQTWSEGNFRIHGLPAETTPSSELHLGYIHPEDKARLEALIADAMAHKSAHEVRYRLIVDGEVKWVEGRGHFGFDADGNAATWSGSIQDITDLQRRERQLRRSRRRVRELAAQRENERENESVRLAREVHDELGQQLTALRLAVHRLEVQALQAACDVGSTIADVKQQIDRTSMSVRSLVQRLRPAVLDFGLAAAVEWLAEDFRARHDAAVELQCALGDGPLPEDVATAVFRSLQEALTNVARHAEASQVTVTLRAEAGDVVLEVEDDGRGFDLAEARRRRSFGLMGMRERALALGGQLWIGTRPGAGTHLVLRVPLACPERDLGDVEGDVE